MPAAPAASSAAPRVALLGLIGLAAAMGIGRFAFTPQLPPMLAEGALTLREGGWLAAANYLGYLVGALAALAWAPRPVHAMRRGLVAVTISTLGMALTHTVPLWIALRAAAGVASALVLVGVSGWALATLAAAGRSAWAGWVYAGVGTGICGAGLLVQALGAQGLSSTTGWWCLGLASAVVTSIVVLGVRDGDRSSTSSIASSTPPPAARMPAPASPLHGAWRTVARHPRLIVAYAALGFGYIIPATYLPAVAREQVADPAVFGWVWPVFGAAAAASTVLAARWFAALEPRRLWATAQLAMAGGVLLPALDTALPMLLASGIAVGGTFMVITMAGMQQARRVGGDDAHRLMAALTAAFAAGQLLGPLVLPAARDAASAIRMPSLAAVALLVATALTLARGGEPQRPGRR